MHAKTIVHLGLKLLGVFLAVRGLLFLCDNLMPGVVRMVLVGLRPWDSLVEDLPYLLASVPLTLAAGFWLMFRGRGLAARIVPDNRPRCPECGYRMKGLAADRCPECGTPRLDAPSTPEPVAAALRCKAWVHIAVRLVGVGLMLLVVPWIVYGGWFMAAPPPGLPPGASPVGMLWMMLHLCQLVLGFSLALNGRWLVNWLASRCDGLGWEGVENRAAHGGRRPSSDVHADRHGSATERVRLICMLTMLAGLCLLIAKSEVVLRCCWFVLADLLGMNPRPISPFHYVVILMRTGLSVAPGVYLLLGGRWVIRRLLDCDTQPSPDDCRGDEPTGPPANSGVVRRVLLRPLLALLGVYLVAISLPDGVSRALMSLGIWLGLHSGGEAAHFVRLAVSRFVGVALGLYLLYGGWWLVGKLARRDAEGEARPGRAWVASLLGLLGIYFCVIAIADLALAVGLAVIVGPGVEDITRFSSLSVEVYMTRPIVAMLKLASGAYLLFGGRWLLDRLVPVDRRFCADCGYDLPASPVEMCPECDAPLDA